MSNQEKVSLKTPKVLLGLYPNLFETGLPDDNGVSYYETDLLISLEAQQTSEFAKLKAAEAAAAKEKWPKGLPDPLKSAFRPAHHKKRQKDGTPYYPAEDFPGFLLMRVKTKKQPQIVDAQLRPITDDAEIFGGCIVRVSVNPNAYQVKGNAGVSFWMNNVQKLGESKRIEGGGRPSAESEFDAVDAEDATADVDAIFDAQ